MWEAFHIYHLCYNLHCISACHIDLSFANKSVYMKKLLLSHSVFDEMFGCSINHT